jgi:hypothetical protein
MKVTIIAKITMYHNTLPIQQLQTMRDECSGGFRVALHVISLAMTLSATTISKLMQDLMHALIH